jgi:UDP-2-acetamido-3-amino-2,3-dideoxy-glucuronate N-acetyltransferase
MPDYYVHPSALVETREIGARTKIWAFAHIMNRVVVGSDCNLGDHVFVESGVQIGNGVTIKNGVCVWEGVVIDDHVFIGPNAVFTNDLNPRSPRFPGVAARYRNKGWLRESVLEEGVSIGANATILCGIRLGRFCMVGAGAIVTKDVPPYRLVYGMPARLRGYVNREGSILKKTGNVLVDPNTQRKYRYNRLKLTELI